MGHRDRLVLLALLLSWVPVCEPQDKRSAAQRVRNPDHSWRPAVVTPALGGIWPHPLHQNWTSKILLVNPGTFKYEYRGSCSAVKNALRRYHNAFLFGGCREKQRRVDPTKWKRRRPPFVSTRQDVASIAGNVDQLVIRMSGPCEHMPHVDMVEKYKLILKKSEAVLWAPSVWGVLRGLESFSQLLYPFDAVMDAMAYNKMNVLHWHIVDDQSFPFVSQTFPNLSMMGAYDPVTHVYRPEQVRLVINEAASRGIRVMAEFDTPGHTRSWGQAHPEILTKCYDDLGDPTGKLGPIDPTRNKTYIFLGNFFKEVARVFPDQYIHLGGDEVSFNCWESNPDIGHFMRKLGIQGKFEKLEEIYIRRLIQHLRPLKKSYVVWQEVFDNNVNIPRDTVVHVWMVHHETELTAVTSAGYKALLSTCWYLDYINYGSDWKEYYNCDPRNFRGTAKQKSLVLGGEACIWAEFVDATNLISRTWPRASAAAERLWSPAWINDAKKAEGRFEEQRCRMLRRGLTVEPQSGPGFCDCDNATEE